MSGSVESAGGVRELAGKGARIRRYFLSDPGLVTLTFVLLNLLRLVSTIVLTRILEPNVFGAVALITSVAFFIVMISDLGFEPFLTRHPQGESSLFRDTVWTIRFIRGVVLTCVLYLAAPAVSRLLAYPELEPLFRVVAFTLFLDAMTSISVVSAPRDRRLATLSLLDLSVAVFQLAVSIYLSLELRSYWGIVWAIVAASALRVLLSFLFFRDPLPRFNIDRSYARELLLFGRFIASSSIIYVILSQADKFLLAKVSSLDLLGLYVLAASLAGFASAFAIAYAGRALYPRYAEIFNANADTLPAHFNAGDLMQKLYPAGVGFMLGIAPLLVAVLYDERYAATSTFLRILLVGAIFSLANYAAQNVLLAIGRARTTLEANLVRLLWLLVTGSLSYPVYGYWGLIWAFATIEVGARLYYFYALNRADLFALRGEFLILTLGFVGAAMGSVAAVLGGAII